MSRSNAVLSFAVANLRRVRFLWVRSVWLVGVFGLGLVSRFRLVWIGWFGIFSFNW